MGQWSLGLLQPRHIPSVELPLPHFLPSLPQASALSSPALLVVPSFPASGERQEGPKGVGVLCTAFVSLNCLVNRSVVWVVFEVGVAAEPVDPALWFGVLECCGEEA